MKAWGADLGPCSMSGAWAGGRAFSARRTGLAEGIRRSRSPIEIAPQTLAKDDSTPRGPGIPPHNKSTLSVKLSQSFLPHLFT